MWPDSIASASAVSSIRSPRAVLMMRSPFLAAAKRAALKMCRVSGVDGMCSDRKSARAQTSSSDTSSIRRSRAMCALMNGSCAMTFISNARARRATSWPMRPETGQAQRLAAHFLAEKALLVPCALLHRRVGGRDFSGKCQHQRHRQFRDADAVGAWRVHDDDAARAGGVHINVVHASAGARDGTQRAARRQSDRPSLSWRCARRGRRRRRDRRPVRPAGGRCAHQQSSLRHAAGRARMSGRSSATMIFIRCMIPYLCRAPNAAQSKRHGSPSRTIAGASRSFRPERRVTRRSRDRFPQGFPQNVWTDRRGAWRSDLMPCTIDASKR